MSSPLDRIEADRLRWRIIHGLNGHEVDPDTVWQAIHAWDALVNVAKAAEEMFRRNDDDTYSEEEVQEAHDLLREALAALGKEPA